jgi:hypothetical protein
MLSAQLLHVKGSLFMFLNSFTVFLHHGGNLLNNTVHFMKNLHVNEGCSAKKSLQDFFTAWVEACKDLLIL